MQEHLTLYADTCPVHIWSETPKAAKSIKSLKKTTKKTTNDYHRSQLSHRNIAESNLKQKRDKVKNKISPTARLHMK